MATCI